MERKIIVIDEDKCNGCGICAEACHEGAIGMVNGKAKLLREDYCDGLGDCLPACPVQAISFEMREAPAYDHAAVMAAQAAKKAQQGAAAPAPHEHTHQHPHHGGCPGSMARGLKTAQQAAPENASAPTTSPSQLAQWPVQIQLVPVKAPFYEGAHLLIAADCTSFAYANFHHDFMRGRVTLIGCPKLDDAEYAEKLTAILQQNDIRSVTVARMQVPCCGGLEHAAQQAVRACGKPMPFSVSVISVDGQLLGA